MRRAWGASGDRVAAMLAAANRADPYGRLGSPQGIAETVAPRPRSSSSRRRPARHPLWVQRIQRHDILGGLIHECRGTARRRRSGETRRSVPVWHFWPPAQAAPVRGVPRSPAAEEPAHSGIPDRHPTLMPLPHPPLLRFPCTQAKRRIGFFHQVAQHRPPPGRRSWQPWPPGQCVPPCPGGRAPVEPVTHWTREHRPQETVNTPQETRTSPWI